jgi:hypothetical protein
MCRWDHLSFVHLNKDFHMYTHKPNTNATIMSLAEAGLIKGPFFHLS